MDTVKAEAASFASLKDLKTLLSSEGPCLSLYMPLSGATENQAAKQNELHWQEALRSLEPQITRNGTQARDLMQSIASWNAVAPNQDTREAKSIAVFRSPDQFKVATFREDLPERVSVGRHFHIRPLLPLLTREESFYLLALSQKDVRMLRCTSHSVEEVPLPAGTATNREEWENLAKSDHNDIDMSATGPSSGHSKGAIAAMGSDDEAKDEYLAHFYKQINNGVTEVLREHNEPLVLCAVEYELPIYRKVNSYEHLAEEAVIGAPNGLKSGEMHARALEALRKHQESEVDRALAEWDHKVGAGASSRLKEVVTAAHDGRVLTLLVSDSLERHGTFNADEHRVIGKETGSAEDEDLVNDAVVQTILHAGSVAVVPHNKMPNGAAMAAIFRYALAAGGR